MGFTSCSGGFPTATQEMYLLRQGSLQLVEVFPSLIEPLFKGLLLLLVPLSVSALSEEFNFLMELLLAQSEVH